MSAVDSMISPPLVRSLALEGIAHLVVPASDLAASVAFYRNLGFSEAGSDVLPHCGTHTALRTASGQMLALVPTADVADLRDTGVHQAYRVSAAERDSIGARLAAQGVEVFTYKEDRPAEVSDNFYFYDPSGNRVQLVVSGKGAGVLGIDHAAIQVPDMLWAEKFYGENLGLAVEHRVGWQTADYVRARVWGEGKEDMAPGTRRLDKRYTVMVKQKTVPRANMQLFLKAGDATLALFLANKHYQESPEEQAIGTPRIAFAAPRAELDRAAKMVAATGRACEGPVVHPQSSGIEASVYFRDTGGNFVELCTPRRR